MAAFVWNGPQVEQEVYLRIKTELNNLGTFLVSKMKSFAPVDTGLLKSSIQFTSATQELSITVYVGPFYGIYQEFGTRYIKPHPYVRPALLEGAERWKFGTLQIDLYPAAQVLEPLRAHGSGFHLPGRQLLTRSQEQHVARHLTPVSKHYAMAFHRRGIHLRIQKGA